MHHSKKTVMLVPPAGGRIRYIRIRLVFLALFFVILLIGFSGYFLPINDYSLDVVEINQKRNLEQQNSKLLERIIVMLRTLNEVRSQIGGLERKRSQVEILTGSNEHEIEPFDDKPAVQVASLGVEGLNALVLGLEQRAQALKKQIEKQPDYLTALPILLPVTGDPVVSAGFGRIRDPFTNTVKQHAGMDFVGRRGAPIIAPASGVVEEAGTDRRWGKYLIIRHSRTSTTFYSHLEELSVGRGKKVLRGDQIGRLGESGISSGPHLHYEVRINNTPVNPMRFLHPLEVARCDLAFQNAPAHR